MNERASPTHDFFISYAQPDLAWVHGYLVPTLGLSRDRTITAQDFAPGVSRASQIEHAVQNSRYTLLVYSLAFTVGEWTDFSEQLASHLSVEEQRGRVVILLLQPFEVPLRLKPRLCLDCTEQVDWPKQVAHLRQMLMLPEPGPEIIDCPYPGMVPFQKEDALRFFGREDEIRELRQRLETQSLILVMGPSGSGKSSLLSAGLMPTLTADWVLAPMRPGPTPLDALQLTLASIGGAVEYLAGGSAPQWPADKHLLLIVDQLEELFVQAAKDSQKAFIDRIRRLHRFPGWKVILVLRADFLSDLMFSDLWPLAPEQRLEIAPLRGENLRPIIQRPAHEQRVYLETGLVERLISDAADEPGALPLLQQTMVLLWEKRQRRLLSLRTYRAMGDGQRSGLAMAVATKANEAFDKLSPEDQILVRRIFLRLVAFGEGRLDTRRQQPLSAIVDTEDANNRTLYVVRHLVEYRLLIVDEKDGTQATVDIAHDVLITGWPNLGTWITQWRGAELTRRWLQTKVVERKRRVAEKQRHSGLLDSAELAEAEKWLASPDAPLLGVSPEVRALVEQSRAASKRSMRLRVGVIGTIIALFMAVLAVITLGQSQLAVQRGQAAATAESLAQAEAYARSTAEIEVVVRSTAEAVAEERRQDAETKSQIALARQLAAQAELMISQDPHSLTQAVLLAIESIKRASTFEGDQALRRGLSLLPKLAFQATIVPADLYSYDRDVSALVFSPDGHWLAAGTLGQIISVRNTSTWKEVLRVQAATSGGYTPQVRTLAFCPDSRQLISGGDGLIAQVWDVTTGQEISRMQHDGQIWSVACSPDGKRVASGSNGKVAVWEAQSGKLIYDVSAPASVILFSQDGDLAASAGGDTVTVWDVATGKTLAQMRPITGQKPGDLESLRALAVSPDGRLVAAGEGGSTGAWLEPRKPVGGRIWVWETATGREVARLTHADEVRSLAYSSDGKWLASGGFDGVVRVWNAQTGQMIGEYQSGAPVTMVSFMHQGAWVAATGLGSLTHIWDVPTGREISRITNEGDAQTIEMAVLPDARLVAVGDNTGRVHLWEILAQETTILSHGNSQSISWLEYSEDGRYLATGTYDKTARVWDTTTGEEISRIGHGDRVLVARFSPDARYVASGSQDGEIKVWDAATGSEKFKIPKVKSVSSIAFSPDGQLVAFGEGTFPRDGWFMYEYGPNTSGPASVYVWNMSTGQEVMRLQHEGFVNSIAFSPDGHWLVSGGDDNIARVWDIGTGGEVAHHQHSSRVNLVAFSPNGRQIASAEACFKTRYGVGRVACDPFVTVWEAASGRAIWREKEPGSWISQLAFSPDGKLVAAASTHAVRVRDVTTGQIASEMNHEDDIVIGMAFSRDGHLIASGGGPSLGTGSVRVWDPWRGNEVARIAYDQAWMLEFNSDGSQLAVGGYEAGETAARVYPLTAEASIARACLRLDRNLTQTEWQQYLSGQPYRETCPEIPEEVLQPNGRSTAPSISADGRYVTFISSASNLVCGDSNSADDAFLYDRQTGALSRVSMGRDDSSAVGYTTHAAMSAGGQYVVYVSDASNLIAGNTNNFQKVFVYDRSTNETLLISRTHDGSPSNGDSWAPSITDDGRLILFVSKASDLVPNDTNERADFFLYDRDAGAITAISAYTYTHEINHAVLSGDGRVIVFEGNANLDAQQFEVSEIFAHELATGQTTPVTDTELERENDPTQYPSHTYLTDVSGDGRYITGIKMLLGNSANGEGELSEVYFLDRTTGQSAYLSLAPDGTLGNRDSGLSRMAADGRYLVFDSESSNLVDNDTNTAWDVFMVDRQNHRVSRVSVSLNGGQANGHSTAPAISRDGRYIVFVSTASNLVPDDTNDYADLFIYDRLLRKTVRIGPRQTACP